MGAKLAGALTAGAVVGLAIAAMDAGAAKPRPAAKLSIRLSTATQAQALRTNRLRVRVVARRAMRVRIGATVRTIGTTRKGRRVRRSVPVAPRRTVTLRRGQGRTVALRLTRSGRRLLAGCTVRRVTVTVRTLRGDRSHASRSRSLRLDPGRCAAEAPLPGCAVARTPGGEWPFYSGTLDGHREQLQEKTITKGNVSGLGLQWMRRMPDGGVIHSTPVVTDGCVYTGTDLGNVYALNADTGKVVWSQALGEGGQGSGTFQGAGIVGSPAVKNRLVYVGATTPKASVLSALDQATGAIVWKSVVDTDAGGGLDSSPVPFDGMVFQAFKGDESSDHSNPGFVMVDGSRRGGGRILVKTHNIPPADFQAGYRGSSIISTPAVDLARRHVFAGTGNPVSPRQHPITNSLIKIDADPASPTFGKIVASQRGTSDSYPLPRDVNVPNCLTEVQWPVGRSSCAQFDFNFLASPNLWRNSKGRQMLGALQKSGVYTAVYTDTMERAWQAVLGIPCFACNLSSTAADENAIYVAVTGGNLYSLDRDTGRVRWVAFLTGSFRYNGLAVANGILYSLNDEMGALQAFDASTGALLLTHPFSRHTGMTMHDMGNSSGVSVARNTVFATSQAQGTSVLFALRLGATGGGDGGDAPPDQPPPPPGGGPPANEGIVATGPGASTAGYLTPVVTISRGATAAYTNFDSVRHNVSSTQGLFRSDLANQGQTVQVTGTEKLGPGTYPFLCDPHPNMKGQLIVR